jgi:imidazolonepropionase-like amidohydrolase
MLFLRSLAAAMATLTPAAHAQAPAARSPVPGAPAGVTAFVDVNVVPMDTERVLPNQTVLIQNGWITTLGPASRVQVPAGAVRINGRGKYLIPGLADMHAHFGKFDSVSMANQLFVWLANGLTTVRSMDYTSAEKGEAELRMRALAAMGKIWSPRVYASAPWAPRNELYMRPPRSGVPASELDSVVAYVAEYKAKGYDHIKLYNEHGSTFDSLAVAARRLGVPIGGHVPRHETLERVLAARVRSIEHMDWFHQGVNDWIKGAGGDPKSASPGNDSLRKRGTAVVAAAVKQAGVWSCPTVVVVRGSNPSGSSYMKALATYVKALHDEGVGLLFGSDKVAIPSEFKALVEMGLTPYQALATGTRNVAAFYGTLDESGTLAAAKRADVVLLNGNPLTDIGNVAQPAGVMIGGRWLAREEIDRRLTAIKSAVAASP